MENVTRDLKLARGILVQNGKVLLVQDIRPGQGHYFLPGGSVEPGESVKAALLREWGEELGWPIEVGSFRGCLEHTWSYYRKEDAENVTVYEMNYLFSVKASEKNLSEDPISKEAHLKFSWIPLSHLSNINILPQPLKSMIPEILDKNSKGLWESTLDA